MSVKINKNTPITLGLVIMILGLVIGGIKYVNSQDSALADTLRREQRQAYTELRQEIKEAQQDIKAAREEQKADNQRIMELLLEIKNDNSP